MATAYTSLLGLALPVTGELSGSWGDTVNTAITSLLDTAVAGTTSITTDADTTLTTTTGASNQARQAIILWNPASGTVTRNITAPAQSKIYTVINASGGTQSIVFRGAGPTTGVTIVKGESAVVAWNGTDFIKVSNTGGSASFTNVTVSGTTTLSALTASTALALDGSKNVVSVTNTGTGNNVLSASPTLTGTVGVAALTASGDIIGNGNWTIGNADTDTITQAASYVTGTQLKSAKVATNTLALAAYDVDGAAYTSLVTLTASNTPTLALTSTGVGTINNMSVGASTASTGAFTTLSASSAVTFTGLSASQAVFTDASDNLVSNAITGTGNVVMSASPTLTGTITAAGITASGNIVGNGNWTIGNADTDTITQAASYVTGTQLKSAKVATNTLALAAYDVDGAAYTSLVTLTASNTPTLALTSTGVGTINNMSVGATTASTGAFTTLSANSTVTFTGLSASQAVFTDASDNLVSNAITGTGNVVMSNSPTLVTPALGTPSSVTLTNATGLPVSTGISGLGTGVATALAVNVGTAGSPVVNGGVLGTPSSGTVTNLTGTASININGTVGATTANTGAFTTLSASSTVTLTGLSASQAVFTDASDNLVSNAITGTGSVVMSASPTLTGTVGVAALTASGNIVGNGNWTIGNADTDTITQAASYVTGTQLKSAKTATNTLSLAAYDVDGAAYTNLVTLTASNTPTLALTSTGVGTINNMSIGATTASTGAFTTVSASGVASFAAGTALLPAITRTGDTNTGIYFPAADTIGFTEGGVEALRLNSNGQTSTSIAGTAALPSFTRTGDENTGIFFPAADTIAFSEGGTEAMRIDSSGNLGLGVTPSAWASGWKALQLANGSSFVNNGATNYTGIFQNAYYNGTNNLYLSSTYALKYELVNGTHAWYTSAAGTAGNAISFTQAMTLDASGNLLVGTTSALGSAKLAIVGAKQIETKGTTTSNAGSWEMYRADNGAKAWEITANGDNFFIADDNFSNYAYLDQNPTAWQFGSDIRIKTDIIALDYGLEAVMAMQPKRYKFIETGKVDIGFIAQELREVVPEAVSGTEKEFSDDDTPQERASKTLGVGKETLIPVLVKAIQEQQALIQTLTARVAALESI